MRNRKSSRLACISIAVAVVICLHNIFVGTDISFKAYDIKLTKGHCSYLSNEMLARGYTKEQELETYKTDVTACFANPDGSESLFCFAVPIRYEDSDGNLIDIDTRIANVNDIRYKDANYIYSVADNNIRPYYPANLKTGFLLQGDGSYKFGMNTSNNPYAQYMEEKNFIGENKNVIVYKNILSKTDLYVYPSSIGTNIEFVIKGRPEYTQLSCWLDPGEALVERQPGGYLTIRNPRVSQSPGDEIGVIQRPVLKDSNGKVSWDSKLFFANKTSDRKDFQINFDQNFLLNSETRYPVRAYTSFELRREKQPDSAVYSARPNMNSYLSNMSVIGNSSDYRIGENRIRFFINDSFPIETDKLNSASFNTYILGSSSANHILQLSPILQDWCSFTGTWEQPIQSACAVSSATNNKNKIQFDITSEVKKWSSDFTGNLEHNGLLLQKKNLKEGEWDMVVSNDSMLFNNYTQINFTS